MPGRGTQHTAVDTNPMQFLQQDEPHQVIGWREETIAVQIYAARQGPWKHMCEHQFHDIMHSFPDIEEI